MIPNWKGDWSKNVKGKSHHSKEICVELKGFGHPGHCSSLELLVEEFALWRPKPHNSLTFSFGVFVWKGSLSCLYWLKKKRVKKSLIGRTNSSSKQYSPCSILLGIKQAPFSISKAFWNRAKKKEIHRFFNQVMRIADSLDLLKILAISAAVPCAWEAL